MKISWNKRIPPEGLPLLLKVEPIQEQIDIIRGKYKSCHIVSGHFEEGDFYFYDIIDNTFKYLWPDQFKITGWIVEPK